MNHKIKEYLKYQRKAKTRHGVHSPFVYQFVEQVLRKKGTKDSNLIFATSRHKKYVNKLINYYHPHHILWLTNREGATENFVSIEQENKHRIKLKSEQFDFDRFNEYPKVDLFLFDLIVPEDLIHAWEKYKPYLTPNSMVLISSLHDSKEQTAAWERICVDKTVRLSLDLYRVGLLFFKEEFKEKQHFVLK